MVIVNLYPFRKTVISDPAAAFEVGVEHIDIGGPAMIRAAAKNMAHVAVVVDPADYQELLEKLRQGAGSAEFAEFRRKLAWKAFQDADAAYQCCCDYAEPTCTIVKHTNPCGIASRSDLREAYRLAVRADPSRSLTGKCILARRPAGYPIGVE
ncbi:hypothetical protein Vretifemale_1742, partial [Volvox reticuliferus]